MTDNPYFANVPQQAYAPQFQWQQPTPAEYWTPATTMPPSNYGVYLEQPYSAPPSLHNTLVAKPPLHDPKLSLSASPVGDALVTKQRKSRAVQACEQCRYRKQRCDEGHPCIFCKENGLDCHYRPTMPTKNDKVIDFLSSWMTAHADGIQVLKERFDSLETFIRTTESKSAKADALSYFTQTNHLRLGTKTAPPKPRTKETDSISSIMLWPEVRKVLSLSGTELPEDYVVRAEDRPVLNSCPSEQNSLASTDSAYAIGNSALSLSIEEGLDLSYGTINRLLDAYLTNIHQLHPFLDRRRLVMSVNHFIDRYGTEVDTQSSRSGAYLEPPAKRRRVESRSGDRDGRRIERSTANAVVLFVLALGAASSQEGTKQTQHPGSRSLIPGLQYFGQATSIAAEHFDGSELVHAHMFLLAGLYKARQGRVSECGSWYSSAARVLLYLIQRHDLTRLYDGATPAVLGSLAPRYDSILTAAWVCLFLENDMLPELRLPQSGIQRLQEILPLPARLAEYDQNINTGSFDEGLFFTAQVKLQRIFQQIIRLNEEGSFCDQGASDLNPTIKNYASSLQNWRNSLPHQLRWNDHDPSPTSCLHARLRYRYWEAKLRILRPFVDFIIHIDPGISRGMTLESCSRDSRGRPRSSNERHLLEAIKTFSIESGEGEVLRIAELCVEAAKQCILSCKNVACNPAGPGSVAIAHSQFHNTLVLAAVSRCERLRHLVPISTLANHFAASMTFLGNLAIMSPVCVADYKALVAVHRTLFGPQAEVT